MRAIVLLLLAISILPAQVVSGWKGQPRAIPAPQATHSARPLRNTPYAPGRRAILGWGGQNTEVIIVQADPEAEKASSKKPAYPADLVINPLWEKEKITPKLIEIP